MIGSNPTSVLKAPKAQVMSGKGGETTKSFDASGLKKQIQDI